VSDQEIVERAYEHFAAGETPEVLDLLAEDVRWTGSEGSFNGGTCTGGQAGLANVFARLGAGPLRALVDRAGRAAGDLRAGLRHRSDGRRAAVRLTASRASG
jgi:hypothetical protein